MSAGSAPRTKTDNRKSRNLGSRVPKDIDGGVTKSSIIEENRQFPQSCLTCARQDDVAVRIVDLKALEGDSHEGPPRPTTSPTARITKTPSSRPNMKSSIVPINSFLSFITGFSLSE